VSDFNEGRHPSGIRGWLLVLGLLLLVGQPARLALAASTALGTLSVRGLPLALLLVARLLVAGAGVAAGIALMSRRPGSIVLAKTALVLSGAIDLFVYATPYFPNNRMPGDTPFYVAASLFYHVAWLLYLTRSTRVRNTFRETGPALQ
jgi:hypothetical protein